MDSTRCSRYVQCTVRFTESWSSPTRFSATQEICFPLSSEEMFVILKEPCVWLVSFYKSINRQEKILIRIYPKVSIFLPEIEYRYTHTYTNTHLHTHHTHTYTLKHAVKHTPYTHLFAHTLFLQVPESSNGKLFSCSGFQLLSVWVWLNSWIFIHLPPRTKTIGLLLPCSEWHRIHYYLNPMCTDN